MVGRPPGLCAFYTAKINIGLNIMKLKQKKIINFTEKNYFFIKNVNIIEITLLICYIHNIRITNKD